MSSDSAIFSDDDDMPLVAKSDLIGHNDNLSINANGLVDSSGDQESYMSEDDEDDMPLVCSIYTYRLLMGSTYPPLL